MARISIKSAKAKGRSAQQWVRDAILARFPMLEAGDVVSTQMGAGGVDIVLSPKAKRLIPVSIEVKARATGFTPLYDYLEQADRKDGLEPVAFVKQDRRKMLAVIDAVALIDLLARDAERSLQGK
ncbi:hypothetical protein OKW76_00335 [Sphingomonas sp. S1-29]|uniref:hypothetical protein n=1 Tax=Sphingomonas sp. S1-29 TaxID=2991074 RepID=UPI002240712E|nr:hypothetical protein [Sphingomonas sp. S1-29]UZK69572.1 hypothetical protein OKW76_00335 [Sphingomonas sp. S1-29]